ncbi:hypothetical protein Pan44_15150 [Caulifigura coniformis]|uniref:Activator of Hsp90 ATPase homologue 1/2-like C-terminal domain-containing protein n=1 Tax=Caulifigura coniformis TaxID=2527983 RepID=A0A517SBJ2_9PLAN|nr:SRPBCC domain-containing protein [Caulifigura coniformis]QDT53493.1 hypothetical protein Pan44_15150 [Caulifigura coniformis]
MPLKNDGSGKRWVEMEVVVPGAPEDVWNAMATGQGNTAWFTRTEIDGGIGGEIRFDFGADGASKGEVTVWEPPLRFGYVERDWLEGAPPVATEISIIRRPGGTCLMRMEHSLSSSSDDWDSHLEGFEKGWPVFFEVLRRYLQHFAGRPAALLRVDSGGTGEELDLWVKLTTALNLAGANSGERRESPRLAGVVELVQQDDKFRHVMLRIDRPSEGIAVVGTYQRGGEARGVVLLYLYGEGAAGTVQQLQEEWSAWIKGLLGEGRS